MINLDHLRTSYQLAKPYPHVVINDLLLESDATQCIKEIDKFQFWGSVTDEYTKTQPQLIKINTITILTTATLTNLNLIPLLDIIFLTSSVIHFKRDFPINKFIPRYIVTSCFLLFSILYSYNLLICYMLFIHVPNHYKLNWTFLKKDKTFTASIITLTTIIFLLIGEKYDNLIYTSYMIDLFKGIIISHIVYEEMYIFKDLKKV